MCSVFGHADVVLGDVGHRRDALPDGLGSLSHLRLQKLQSRVWTNLKRVGGPLEVCAPLRIPPLKLWICPSQILRNPDPEFVDPLSSRPAERTASLAPASAAKASGDDAASVSWPET